MSAVIEAAERLSVAAATSTPCAPVRELIGSTDVESAYAVQTFNAAMGTTAGRRIIGRKIGLTSEVVQAQLGVDQPDFGVLFDDMEVGLQAPMSRLLQPKVEAEIAFVLRGDLDGEITPDSVRAAVDHAVVALEIVDSRIAGWDITFADTVADNASSGLFTLGMQRLSLDEFEPRDTYAEMSIDGVIVSTGTGEACLGDPLIALEWLARTAQQFEQPLRAGQVILSGALGPMAPVAAGQEVAAVLTTSTGQSLGSVTVTFTGESA